MTKTTIKVSKNVKNSLKKGKGNKTWDEYLLELKHYAEVAKEWIKKTTTLEFESYGDPDCEHEIKRDVTVTGDGSYFLVWRCEKCGLEAFQYLGEREYSWKDVVELAKKALKGDAE